MLLLIPIFYTHYNLLNLTSIRVKGIWENKLRAYGLSDYSRKSSFGKNTGDQCQMIVFKIFFLPSPLLTAQRSIYI